jgi:AbrB family looped-hinge helix DNA binding protein
MADLKVYKITEKGQFTIPKRLREKYQIKRKVMMIEDEKGIILLPVPSPNDDSV